MNTYLPTHNDNHKMHKIFKMQQITDKTSSMQFISGTNIKENLKKIQWVNNYNKC